MIHQIAFWLWYALAAHSAAPTAATPSFGTSFIPAPYIEGDSALYGALLGFLITGY